MSAWHQFARRLAAPIQVQNTVPPADVVPTIAAIDEQLLEISAVPPADRGPEMQAQIDRLLAKRFELHPTAEAS